MAERAVVPPVRARSLGMLEGRVRPVDVLRFNAPLPELALAVALGGTLVAAAPAPRAIRAMAAIGGLSALYLATASAVAAQLVFGGSLTTYAWLAGVLGGTPSRFVNITTGFDDTTGTLVRLWPDSEPLAVDWFDPETRHEAALLRARAIRPPQCVSVLPGNSLPVKAESVDAALLLMAAHEVREPASRATLFAEATRILRPGGRLVIVEHARDIANALAFGPGALHFHRPMIWRAAGAEAGLRLIGEQRRTPFVRVFVFERRPDTEPGASRRR